MSALDSVSRSLSFLLRHGALREGVPMSSEGYVLVSDLRGYRPLAHVSLECLREVVSSNSKKRFELDECGPAPRIRAVQGHSIQNLSLDSLYESIGDPSEIPVCIHGTTLAAWRSIEKSGLSRMDRTHIHMSVGLPGASGVISGMRSSSRVLIYVDAAKCMRSGIRFVRSKNGVILSEGVEGVIAPEFFSRVVDSVSGSQLYP